MITAIHPLPEELMAYVDGEVRGTRKESLAPHLAECEECRRAVAQFEDDAKILRAWTVEAVPAGINEKIQAAGAEHDWTASRWRFPTWSKWALGLGLSAAAVLFLAQSRREDDISPYASGPAQPARSEATKRVQTEQAGKAYDQALGRKQQRALSESLDWAAPAGIVGGQVPTLALAPAAEPMIARTVSLVLVVKDFASARANVDEILARHGGYAAQLTANTAEGVPRTLQASLRVPARELTATLAELKMLGRVENESQAGEEVTQQHADLVARLQNARETEQRLQAILQQRTGKVSDVLAVEQEIARVRGEIEEIEAEQQSLEHRVEFATVKLQLSDEYKAQLVIPPLSAGTRLHNAAVEGYRNLGETLLGIGVFFAEYGPTLVIWALLLGLPVFFAWRRYRRSLAAI
jgi:anti-sigma factor RsiW